MSVTTASIITKIRGLIKDLLRTDGRNAFEYDNDRSFTLSESYIVSTGMKVYLNGTELSSSNWSYNSNTNKVTITIVVSGLSLVKGDNILITFSYYSKYSDSEITSYIKSNLVRFTQKKYKKTFYMNSSNEVVSINDVCPTEQEGDIIALVTAIDIDPQNISVRIGNDFSITASEKKSKSELIDSIFSEFTKSYGIIDFLQIEEN
jgi:hypothetical protein